MVRRQARVAGMLLLAIALAACTVSPEAARTRGGGPGADVGNHGAVVQIHGTTNPGFDVRGVGKSAQASKQGTQSTTNAPRTAPSPSPVR